MLFDCESMGPDTVVDQKHCAPHIAAVMNKETKYSLYREMRDGAHNILKFPNFEPQLKQHR